MSSPSSNPVDDLSSQPTCVPDTNTTHFKLPSRYLDDGTVACLIFSEYSEEAKQAFDQVQEKAREWLGDESTDRDSGSLLNMSMTLFLTPSQRTELTELVRDTPLEIGTVRDFVQSIEQGVKGDSPRIESSGDREELKRLELGVNAGHALRELSSGAELPWERQRSLAFDVWKGMIQLQNFAASILQNVQVNVTGDLIKLAQSSDRLSDTPSVFGVAEEGIYKQASQLTMEFSQESGHLREVQDALLPLARALLAQPSPILKEIVYSQLDSTFNLLGRGLGLYESDPQPMLNSLEDWKAFWDTQVPLLSRYFKEIKAERAEAQATGESPDSKWRLSGGYQGEKTALSPLKWDETVFNQLRSQHLWGMRHIGVPGVIGDRAFDIVSEVLSKANAEALACRPAFAETLMENELGAIPGTVDDSGNGPAASERYIAELRERKLQEASQLVHGITDLMISGLPWILPQEKTPLPVDPELHLERTLRLLEQFMSKEGNGPGLSFAAQAAAEELAIQLETWDYVEILDTKPGLAEQTKRVFQAAQVSTSLPDDWCIGLRKRGIL